MRGDPNNGDGGPQGKHRRTPITVGGVFIMKGDPNNEGGGPQRHTGDPSEAIIGDPNNE